MDSQATYLSLMLTIRERFDAIEDLRKASSHSFSRAEAAAFHGRKIVEGIAFACLVAIDNGLKQVPRKAKGQWNAKTIFESLKPKGLSVLPSPSLIRQATPEEQSENDVSAIIEGIPDRRLTHDDLISIYQALHPWLHEVNPYVHADHAGFLTEKTSRLWDDLAKLRLCMERHFISIGGNAFFCVLWDSNDQQTKVVSLSKDAA